MTIKQLRESTWLSQSKFAKKFHIPIGTLQHWEQGVRKPPEYVMYMINIILIKEETNGVYRTKRIKRKYEE